MFYDPVFLCIQFIFYCSVIRLAEEKKKQPKNINDKVLQDTFKSLLLCVH